MQPQIHPSDRVRSEADPLAIDRGPDRFHVVMVGLMATGKTIVAEGLAGRLGVAFSDNDRMVGAVTGLTAREIREQRGVAALHDLEARHLLDALRAHSPSVISSAASIVDDERCRAALGGPGVLPIWLRASAATLAARFHNEVHRPIFAADLEALFAKQIAIRTAQFLELDAATIDVDELDANRVIERAFEIVKARLPGAANAPAESPCPRVQSRPQEPFRE
jgi:shikimate kinase